MMNAEVQSRAARIKLFLMDCDGVLTDGRIWVLESGEDQKAFNTRDGLGLEIFHRAGLKSGVISGRISSALTRRAAKLGMSYVRQGCEDKEQAVAEILADAMPSVAAVDRQLYASIVGGLCTLERHLTDLGRSGSPVKKEGV